MECYYLRVYDRWLFGATEYVTSHSETLVLVTIVFIVLTMFMSQVVHVRP